MDGLVNGLSDRFSNGGVQPGVGGRSGRGRDGETIGAGARSYAIG